jgi:hypothetical protein
MLPLPLVVSDAPEPTVIAAAVLVPDVIALKALEPPVPEPHAAPASLISSGLVEPTSRQSLSVKVPVEPASVPAVAGIVEPLTLVTSESVDEYAGYADAPADVSA